MKGSGWPETPNFSPKNRKRKLGRGVPLNLDDLGFQSGLRQVPISRDNVEVYVHIKSKDPVKCMKRYNRWLLEKYISGKTKAVTKASFNRDGDLILRIKGEDEAEKIIKTEKLGDWAIEASRHATLNVSKGVIRSYDMCWQKEEDIVTALNEKFKVKEVYIPKRVKKATETSSMGSGQEELRIPTGTIIITFDQVEPPRAIPYGFEKLEVRPYIPNPMKCGNCQELGHTKKRCNKSYILCSLCGHEKSEQHTCQEKRCVNCIATGHTADSRDCPTWLKAKEIESIMVLQRKTRFEARKHFFDLYRSLENFMALRGLTAAEVLKRTQESNSSSNTTQQPKGEETTKIHKGQQKQIQNNKTEEKGENNKVAKITKRRGAVEVQLSPPRMATETIKQQATSSNDIIDSGDLSDKIDVNKNSFKLHRFKKFTGGITYYIEAHFEEGEELSLDLSKFKGSGEKYNSELKYIKEVFENKKMIKSIQDELKKNANHNFVKFTNDSGEFFIGTNDILDVDSSSGSDSEMSLS